MTTLTFKVADEEARRIRGQARKEKITVSEYLRRRALAPAPKRAKLKLVSCPLTGAAIFAPVPDLAPITTESVKEMLADFP